jgi:TetR/AcrR family transcriptional repressor of nem operon
MNRSTRRTRSASHERIVEAGARAIRRQGYDALSIASVMKEADLTHGGFYAHFASREAMLVELSDRAGAQAVAVFSQIAAAAAAETALQALLRSYLSETHVKQPDIGCPIAALGTEMPRQAPPVRRAATHRIKEMIDLISRQSADWGRAGAHERALVTTATLVGTVVLARAIDEAALSESVLRATRAHLGAAHDHIPDTPRAQPPTPKETP